MRVLMVTAGWPSRQAQTTHFIKRQAEFLRAAGVDVEVFHFRGGQKFRNYVTAWARVRSRLMAGRYDLVHAQFGQSGLLALPKRVPLIVTLRGDDLQGIIDDTSAQITIKGRILRRLSRWVASRADAVIVVSERMKSSSRKWLVAKQARGSSSSSQFAWGNCEPQNQSPRVDGSRSYSRRWPWTSKTNCVGPRMARAASLSSRDIGSKG